MSTILIITLSMSLTGYVVNKLGQKHTILFAILVPLMIILDGITVYLQHNMDHKNIMTGVMMGTLIKIIIFLNNETN